MPIIKGVVQSMGTKEVTTKFGLKPTYSVNVDGTWYKFGFTKPRCNKGDEVEFSSTEGAYGMEGDAKTVRTIGGTSSAPTGTAVPKSVAGSYGGKGVFPIPEFDGQRSIVRQNAITNARELYVGSQGTKAFVVNASTVKEIIQIARAFESYACGDIDSLAAKEGKELKKATATPTAEEVTGE